MIPGGRGALCASAGEGEVLKMETGKILGELHCIGLIGEMFPGAALESGGENILGEPPGLGERVRKQLIQQWLESAEPKERRGLRGVATIFGSTVHTVCAACCGPKCILQR